MDIFETHLPLAMTSRVPFRLDGTVTGLFVQRCPPPPPTPPPQKKKEKEKEKRKKERKDKRSTKHPLSSRIPPHPFTHSSTPSSPGQHPPQTTTPPSVPSTPSPSAPRPLPPSLTQPSRVCCAALAGVQHAAAIRQTASNSWKFTVTFYRWCSVPNSNTDTTV